MLFLLAQVDRLGCLVQRITLQQLCRPDLLEAAAEEEAHQTGRLQALLSWPGDESGPADISAEAMADRILEWTSDRMAAEEGEEEARQLTHPSLAEDRLQDDWQGQLPQDGAAEMLLDIQESDGDQLGDSGEAAIFDTASTSVHLSSPRIPTQQAASCLDHDPIICNNSAASGGCLEMGGKTTCSPDLATQNAGGVAAGCEVLSMNEAAEPVASCGAAAQSAGRQAAAVCNPMRHRQDLGHITPTAARLGQQREAVAARSQSVLLEMQLN